MSDTKNELTDFDFCIALGEMAINTQMAAAWKAWKKRGDFEDTVSIFKTKKNGKIVDSKAGMTAKFAPMEVSLTVPNGKLAQAGVTLRLLSGSVTYVDEETGDFCEEPVNDWSFTFIADLDRQSVDRNALAIIDPVAAQTVSEVIDGARNVSDDAFSIEYLFLQLSSIDMMLLGDRQISIPDEVPEAAKNRAKASLNTLFSGVLGNYPLGTVVRRNAKQSVPTFAVTDFIMHVNANKDAPRASTLAYLGMFSGRPLPEDRNGARIKLQDAWVAPDRLDGTTASVSGVMAISRSVMLEQYLIPKFEDALGTTATKKGRMTWTFERDWHDGDEKKDVLRHRLDRWDDWQMTLEGKVGTNTLEMYGQVHSRTHYNGYSWVDLKFWDDEDTILAWIHNEGSMTFKGKLNLVGSGTEADFRLEPRVEKPAFSELNVIEDDASGLAQAADFLEGGLKQMGISGNTGREQLQSAMQGDVDGLKNMLTDALSGLEVDMSQHAFVPPGGGVYSIGNPRFSEAGDMLLDVIYNAPRAGKGA